MTDGAHHEVVRMRSGVSESSELREQGQYRAVLEVRRRDTDEITTFGLSSGHQVIGRSPDLSIVLEHESVSRLHAEMVLGPWDRWWIHDLGSTNGTLVNGTPVTQRLLNSGDVIEVGAYTLTLRVLGVSSRSMVTEPPPPVGTPPSTKRIPAMDASRLGAAYLYEASVVSRELMRIEDRQARLTRLCEYVTSERFPGLSCWVIAVHDDGMPELRLGPVTRDREAAELDRHEQRALEYLFWEHKQRLLSEDDPMVLDIAASAGERVVACRLSELDGGADVFCVKFPAYCTSGDWPSMVKILTEGWQQASELWEMRAHFRTGATIDHELKMARQIQDRLVPKTSRVEGLEVAIGYEPSQWVGGDYVDAVPMADGRTLIAVADVCGKGLQAALVASSLHTLVHVLVDTSPSLPDLVKRVNAYLCEYLPIRSFVTMIVMAIDAKTRDVECVNAGHPPAFLIGADGSVVMLQSERNVALGIVDFDPVSEHYVTSPGDVLMLYTDGLTEAEDLQRQTLGVERLRAEAGNIAQYSPDGVDLDSIRRRISHRVNIHRGSLMASDDTTFLLARISSEPQSRADITTEQAAIKA